MLFAFFHGRTNKPQQSDAMNNNLNAFGRTARNHGHRGRGRSGRGGRGGRGGRHHRGNNRSNVQPNVANKNFNHVHFIESSGTLTQTSFNIAVQGCSHGELDSIYQALESYRNQTLNESNPNKSAQIDVLLCCGDVQTLRNTDDYHALAVPQKYKTMGDFHQYYSGSKAAPILTIMIGGNHEASNYLQELYYGGWVAPNIYYLGAAGVVNLCKWSTDKTNISTLRIAGLSGIYKSHDFKLGRFEAPPYSQSELRSVYHTRHFEVERLRAVASSTDYAQKPIDIMISHDWPRGIEQHGNVNKLIQQKPFFKQEIQSNSLGSPANEILLHALKPKYWFAAHLHVKFEAAVQHARVTEAEARNAEGEKNPNVDSDTNATHFVGMETNEGICPTSEETNIQSLTDQMTRFLSLDKCLPKRRHIQVLHVEPSSSRETGEGEASIDGLSNQHSWLEYDEQWLAIHRRTEDWSQRTHNKLNLPQDEFQQAPLSSDELQDIINRFTVTASNEGNSQGALPFLAIPLNFVQTVRPHNPRGMQQYGPPCSMVGNPQTDQFLEMLGMEHKLTIPFQNDVNTRSIPAPPQMRMPTDENEIVLDNDEDAGEGINNTRTKRAMLKMPAPQHINDVNEIDLDANEVNADPDEIDLNSLDDEAGDAICYTTDSAVKRPRV